MGAFSLLCILHNKYSFISYEVPESGSGVLGWVGHDLRPLRGEHG